MGLVSQHFGKHWTCMHLCIHDDDLRDDACIIIYIVLQQKDTQKYAWHGTTRELANPSVYRCRHCAPTILSLYDYISSSSSSSSSYYYYYYYPVVYMLPVALSLMTGACMLDNQSETCVGSSPNVFTLYRATPKPARWMAQNIIRGTIKFTFDPGIGLNAAYINTYILHVLGSIFGKINT